MKKYLHGLSYLLIGLVLGSFIPIQSLLAESPIKLIVNGITLQDDLQPISFQNHVYVPAKKLSEALGANVSWDQSRNAVIINSLGEVINNTNTNSTITSNTTSPTVNPTVDPKNIVPLNTTSNTNQNNLAETEKKEYLLLMKEAGDIGVEGYDLLMQNNPTDTELSTMSNKVQTMKDKFNSWGVANQEYKESKVIYIDLLTNLDSALYTRNFMNYGGTLGFNASNQYKEYTSKINEDITKLKAEVNRLKKLGLI